MLPLFLCFLMSSSVRTFLRSPLRPSRLLTLRPLSSNSDAVDIRRRLVAAELRKLGLANPERLWTYSDDDDDGGGRRLAHEQFGRPAVRTFNSYVLKGGGSPSIPDLAQARRTAQQIEHSFRRHKAAISDTFRNTDASSSNYKALRRPLAIVLDNLRSAGNVGSILRTCDACGINTIHPVGITPSPLSVGREKVVKASLGAEQNVDTGRRFETLREGLAVLKGEGWRIVAMETCERAEMLYNFDFTDGEGAFEKTAIVVGNEVTGIDEDIINDASLVDHVLTIPMFGTKNSLNAAVAAGVVAYEVVRQIENS